MATKKQETAIKEPNIQTAAISIRGTSELVIERFSEKVRHLLEEKHKAGSQGKKVKVKEARDFEADFNGARYVSTEGWDGIHCSAFRGALVSACRLCGVKMTMAKIGLFVVADGRDKDDGSELVRISGEPEMFIAPTRNATGVADLRARPRYAAGWEASVRVQYDADMFSRADVIALMKRVGKQIGVGAGRYDAKMSGGLGWGCFEVVGD